MQLPAFFGHQKSINLLPRDTFESSQVGILLIWLLSFGKWAVIITQLIVMGAFLWRFTLDRELTDLKKNISKNVAIIKSYEAVERDFVLTQKRLEIAKNIIEQQGAILDELSFLSSITPLDMWYEKLTITPKSSVISAYSGSLLGFSYFLSKTQQGERYSAITIARIQNGGAQNAKMQFEVSLTKKMESKQ